MNNIFIIGFIVCLLLSIYNIYSIKHIHEKNEQIDKENKIFEKRHSDLRELIHNKKLELQSTEDKIKDKQQQFNDLQNNINKTAETQEEISRKAFENYCEVLQKRYDIEEEEYDAHIELLKDSYSNLQLKLMREADECRQDLDKIRATRAAAIEAQRKEEEIKQNISSYCIIPSKNDLEDIKRLEKIKIDLHNPDILSKLIWSTYYQKEMTKFCNNMLGTNTVCGIYKITNQINGKCYIGQSVNVASRFKDHMRAGLGINNSSSNKLYKAMQEDGVWNFSWELLEKCSREQLNEKEKFYIELYGAKEFGYNTQAGNK